MFSLGFFCLFLVSYYIPIYLCMVSSNWLLLSTFRHFFSVFHLQKLSLELEQHLLLIKRYSFKENRDETKITLGCVYKFLNSFRKRQTLICCCFLILYFYIMYYFYVTLLFRAVLTFQLQTTTNCLPSIFVSCSTDTCLNRRRIFFERIFFHTSTPLYPPSEFLSSIFPTKPKTLSVLLCKLQMCLEKWLVHSLSRNWHLMAESQGDSSRQISSANLLNFILDYLAPFFMEVIYCCPTCPKIQI